MRRPSAGCAGVARAPCPPLRGLSRSPSRGSDQGTWPQEAASLPLLSGELFLSHGMAVAQHSLADRARRKSPSVCSGLKLEELWTKKMLRKKGLDLRFPAVQISPRCLAECGEEPVRWMCREGKRFPSTLKLETAQRGNQSRNELAAPGCRL